MRKATVFLTGLITVCLAASVSQGQFVRTAPSVHLSPVPTGIGGAYGSSGLGGISSPSLGPINSIQSSLPQLDPAPQVLPDLYHSNYGINSVNSVFGASTSSEQVLDYTPAPHLQDDSQYTADIESSAAVIGSIPEGDEYESYETGKAVTLGPPGDDGESDSDDSEEDGDGISWWVWLIVAVAVAGVIAKLSD